ncbi:cytochrome P450 [Streptomyces sp. NPDC051320]|uniref:cytochrome P450 n=1 Tax=Streptomyces sp. NPDC051320 TaxID=3154644 RepID=UPI0034432C94
MSDTEEEIRDFPMSRTCPMAPPPAYTELRDGPPRRVRLPDGTLPWILTRHADVREAMGDPRMSMDESDPLMPHRLLVPRIPRLFSFIRMDEPEHGRLRRMVTSEFTARSVRELRPWIQQIIDQLIDDLEALPQPVDLAAEFAIPLPCLVIARIFGVPDEDIAQLKEQTTIGLSQDVTPEQAIGAQIGMSEYLDQLAVRKAAEGTDDDLIGRLCADFVAAGKLTHEDLVGMVRLVLVAGHETSANQLGLSILSLLQHPGQLAEIKADPALIRPAVEEMLRFWAISQDNIVRVAADDMELGGVHIAKGDPVVLAIPAANHDETVFPDAARFDIHRAQASQHLTFGHGAHYCLGATLATTEMEMALTTLFDRLPGLRLAVPEEDLSFRDTSLVYGLNRLPVTW